MPWISALQLQLGIMHTLVHTTEKMDYTADRQYTHWHTTNEVYTKESCETGCIKIANCLKCGLLLASEIHRCHFCSTSSIREWLENTW